MSEIKNKDRILEAIDQLRRRKARPDADRICNFLLRRFSVTSKDTIADLERMVQAEIVIRVEYKGNISYRNAAKWSRLAVYKHKENALENNNVEIRSLLSRAFASLLVEDPDYLDFGVPENELKKSILEEDPCLEWSDVDNILQKERNSGYLVKLKNNNYSLADHPVPACTTNGNLDTSGDVHMLKFESSSSSHCEDEPCNFNDNTESDIPVKSPSPEETDFSNSKAMKDQDEFGSNENETSPHIVPPSAINVGGFRVGVRRKRAKKVFDPSDNNVPTRKRGRPLGSTNKSKEVPPVAVKVDSLVAVCSICNNPVNSRRGLFEKFLTCATCGYKAHSSCLGIGDKFFPYWQCMQCKVCPHCMQSGEFEPLVICWGCGDGWHPYCHSPEVIDKTNGTKWHCFRCVSGKLKNGVNGLSNTSPHASPMPDASASSYPASASVTSCDSDDQVDECIPDASEWTVDQVSSYFSGQGYPEEAAIFKLNEIDGASLLLMKRSDVLLGLQLKLGPALKLYGQVKRLQIRQNDPQLIWA